MGYFRSQSNLPGFGVHLWQSWVAAIKCFSMGLALALLSNVAFGQSVLFLTTNEAGHTSGSGNTAGALDNMASEFTAAGADVTRQSDVLTAANGISASTFTNPATGQPYDIVLIGAAYGLIHASNWTVLQAAMETRAANAFVMFIDGCGNCGAKVDELAAVLSNVTGLTLGTSPNDNTPDAQPFYLNTASPFQASFAGLNPIVGYYTRYITNVPANNILYKRRTTGTTNPPNPTGPGNAYGVLFPTAQSNNGQGACLFAVDDLSVFIDHSTSGWAQNQGKIAPAFLNAVSADGACGIPASIRKAFSPETVGPGDVTTLTVTIDNQGTTPLTGVLVRDSLPAPLQVHGDASAVTSTCTGGSVTVAPDAASVALQGASVPPGGCTLTVPVRWPAASASLCVAPGNTRTNTITPGVDFTTDQGQAFTPATAQLACVAGALNLTKQLVWAAGSQPTDMSATPFGMSVSCTSASGDTLGPLTTQISVDHTTGVGTASVAPVVTSGTCQVSESGRPPAPTHHEWAESTPPSGTVSMQAAPASNALTLVNTLRRASAALQISVSVSGGPSTGVSGVFSFEARCGADGVYGGSISLSQATSGTGTISGIPAGATCEVVELPALPAAPTGHTWGALPSAQTVSNLSSAGATVSFANTLVGGPVAVPTLGQWLVLLLSGAVAGLGALAVRRGFKPAH